MLIFWKYNLILSHSFGLNVVQDLGTVANVAGQGVPLKPVRHALARF